MVLAHRLRTDFCFAPYLVFEIFILSSMIRQNPRLDKDYFYVGVGFVRRLYFIL